MGDLQQIDNYNHRGFNLHGIAILQWVPFTTLFLYYEIFSAPKRREAFLMQNNAKSNFLGRALINAIN